MCQQLCCLLDAFVCFIDIENREIVFLDAEDELFHVLHVAACSNVHAGFQILFLVNQHLS